LRLLLDAHVSGRAIGRRLREAGHDVLALGDDRQFEALADDDVLRLAAREGRVLVTFNVKDFAAILRDWADEDRDHAGCILMVGMDHSQFGTILRALESALGQRPDQQAWCNLAVFLSRPSV
jgi:NAD(P)-dependent dehydrogenase (short-subunit alcohol dehydrogenase family)